MVIDALTDLTYLPVYNSTNLAASINVAPLQIGGLLSSVGNNTVGVNTGTAGFKGRLALVVSAGTAAGTTPSVTGYFKSGPDTNVLNATNIVLSTYNLSGNALAANPLNSNVASFTTNGGNQILVFGFDTRAVGNYIYANLAVAGTNSPGGPMSIVLVGTKAYEPS